MVTPVWPVTLPQKPVVGGWSRTPQDNRVVFQPDVGPPIVRRRATVRAHNYEATFPVITDAQLVIFDAFFETDLADGSLHYLWFDPVSGTDHKWRIVSYTVDAIGAAQHRLTMQVIRLPGAATISAPAVVFDGGDYLIRSSDLGGNADSTAVSGYVKFSTVSVARDTLIQTNGSKYRVESEANGKISILLFNAAAALVLDLTSTAAYNDGSAHEVHWSYNGVTPSVLMYIDGVQDTNTPDVLITGTVDLTTSAHAVGAQTGAANPFTGTMYRATLYNDKTLDVSDSGVRQRMSTGFGSALGNNIVDFYGPAATWNAGNNQGSGLDYVMTGAVV